MFACVREWLDKDMTWLAPPDGSLGRSAVLSDTAIQFCLTIKVLFKLPLRQIEPWKRHWSERPWQGGIVASLLKLADLNWAVPDDSTL